LLPVAKCCTLTLCCTASCTVLLQLKLSYAALDVQKQLAEQQRDEALSTVAELEAQLAEIGAEIATHMQVRRQVGSRTTLGRKIVSSFFMERARSSCGLVCADGQGDSYAAVCGACLRGPQAVCVSSRLTVSVNCMLIHPVSTPRSNAKNGRVLAQTRLLQGASVIFWRQSWGCGCCSWQVPLITSPSMVSRATSAVHSQLTMMLLPCFYTAFCFYYKCYGASVAQPLLLLLLLLACCVALSGGRAGACQECSQQPQNAGSCTGRFVFSTFKPAAGHAPSSSSGAGGLYKSGSAWQPRPGAQ